ncbi:MAG: hypothetical protein ACRDKH_05055 [Solirubrobacterales bacterium]
MSGRLAAIGLIATSLLVAGCGDDDEDSADRGGSESESFLFTQSAREAILDRTEGTLTLIDASPSVGYFSDRPERTAGQISFASFSAEWDRAFGDDPPNAAIQHLGGPRGAPPAVVELLAPPRHEGGRSVTYEIRPVNAPPQAPPRVRFAEVALFIDPCLGCVGSADEDGGGGDGAGATGLHCTITDPRCATTGESLAGCNWGGECAVEPKGAQGCNPITDPRCDGSGAQAVGKSGRRPDTGGRIIEQAPTPP